MYKPVSLCNIRNWTRVLFLKKVFDVSEENNKNKNKESKKENKNDLDVIFSNLKNKDIAAK